MTTGKQLAALLLLSTALTHPGAAFAQDAAATDAAAAQPRGATPEAEGRRSRRGRVAEEQDESRSPAAT